MRLEAKNLSFGYDDSRKILADISFTLEGANIFAILGRNGMGKSTLLSCLIDEYDYQGTVRVDGKNIHDYSQRELARKIAYIPQSHQPTFPFRVLDIVMMGRSAHMRYFGTPDQEAIDIAMKYLTFLGIEKLAEKPYTNISGGERQLVLLAAALTQEPDFLILDEPTAHLDFGNAQRFLDLILRLREEGLGILMTTHFPDHALYLKATTLLLQDKQIRKVGPAEEVITESAMSSLYGLPVHLGQIGSRSVCVAGDIHSDASDVHTN